MKLESQLRAVNTVLACFIQTVVWLPGAVYGHARLRRYSPNTPACCILSKSQHGAVLSSVHQPAQEPDPKNTVSNDGVQIYVYSRWSRVGLTGSTRRECCVHGHLQMRKTSERRDRKLQRMCTLLSFRVRRLGLPTRGEPKVIKPSAPSFLSEKVAKADHHTVIIMSASNLPLCPCGN